MVDTQTQPTGEADRFIDWMYNMTGQLVAHVGLSEQQASRTLEVITRTVQEEYGGSRVYVTAATTTQTHKNRTEVLELWEQGVTTEKIAARLNIAESTVYKIIRRKR